MSIDLKKLNEDTFTAEAQGSINGVGWDKFLQRVLSGDFRIRRSNPTIPLQNRDEMIAHIQKDTNPVKRHPSNVVVFEDGGYGVVHQHRHARRTAQQVSQYQSVLSTTI